MTLFLICSNRKDFRPAYAKLGVLGNYFPQVPIVGLTATANCKTQGIICDSLGLLEPAVIKINPDRENIYFASYKRKSTKNSPCYCCFWHWCRHSKYQTGNTHWHSIYYGGIFSGSRKLWQRWLALKGIGLL